MKRLFKDGQTVLFYGDSVTDAGRNKETGEDLGLGYPDKVKKLYDILFPDNRVNFVNRGVGGNRTKDLVVRLDRDCLSFKPDFISILIGVNDAWRKYDSNDPTSTQDFEANYRTVLSRIRKELPDARIFMIEPYVLFAHHGFRGGSVLLYEMVDASVVLVSTREDRFKENLDRETTKKAVDLAREVYIAGNGTVGLQLPYRSGTAVIYPKEVN